MISDGLSVTQAAEKAGVSRQTEHAWLAASDVSRGRSGGAGAAALTSVLGPRRLVFELTKRKLSSALSEDAKTWPTGMSAVDR